MKAMLTFLVLSSAFHLAAAQMPNFNPGAPKVGTTAPPLKFSELLQAPAGTKAEWPALKGKVVVLEFWATWCVPCVAEIPVLNSLAASLDPAKVQFIAVDDEEPAKVKPFLAKTPITGWLGFDPSSAVFDRYGVGARPATIIIGPDGRVVNTTVRPERLRREQLLALADGKPVVFDDRPLGLPAGEMGSVGKPAAGMPAGSFTMTAPNSSAGGKSGMPAGMGMMTPANTEGALFAISVAPATPGSGEDVHSMQRGPGQYDVINAKPLDLLNQGAHIPKSRITVEGDLPPARYDLHVEAPKADAKDLQRAIELAVAAGTGVTLTHHTAPTEAYVLKAGAPGELSFGKAPFVGFAGVNKFHKLQCLNASPDQVAAALEKLLGKPVVNETGFTGAVNATIDLGDGSLGEVRKALAGQLGIVVEEGMREVETYTLAAGK